MKKILLSVAIIAAVGAIAFGATRAYFNDTQSSTGNTISAGTLDLQLMCPEVTVAHMDALHPETGTDTTGAGIDTLSGAELTSLGSSDDTRYTSNYGWYTDFSNVTGETWPVGYLLNENLNFGIPNIPADATLTTANATMEWQRGTGINAARVRVYNGSTWQIQTISPLPTANTDTVTVIDLAALGFDTKAELDALQIQFQATQSGGYNWNDVNSKTSIDLIEVNASYTTTGPAWCDDALTNGFNVTNIAPSATGNAVIEYKNNGTINGNLTMTISNIVDADNNCNGPETTAGDVTCGPADGGEMSQYLHLYNGAIDLGTLTTIAATPVSLGAVAAGANSSLTLGYELPSATGNIVQSDGVTFDVNFTLAQ